MISTCACECYHTAWIMVVIYRYYWTDATKRQMVILTKKTQVTWTNHFFCGLHKHATLLGFLLTTPFAMDFQCWHSAWSFEISLRSLFISMESSILSVESCLSLLPKLWLCSSWSLLSSLSLINSCCLLEQHSSHI